MRRHPRLSAGRGAGMAARAVLAAGILAGAAACGGPPGPPATPRNAAVAVPGTTAASAPGTSTGAGSSRPGPLYGVTVDDVANLSAVMSGLRALPYRPTVRVVFDGGRPAAYYLPAVRELSSVGTVMGELLDSSEEQTVTPAGMSARVGDYLGVLGPYVGIWEVGNEVNGNWLGPYSDVAARLISAFHLAVDDHARTALTLYANDWGPARCGDGSGELTPEEFSSRYLPTRVRDGLDYVFLSYYPDQCQGLEPPVAQVREELEQLHALYPSAALGWGEVGLPDAVSAASAGRARQVMKWAYSLDPGLSYYVGGYFWWYAAEDALGPERPLAPDLTAAFYAEHAALAGG